MVIVGAHYDRNSSAQRPLDNWSGAAPFRRFTKACAAESAATVLFSWHLRIAAANPVGAQVYVSHMARTQLDRVEAMVNLDALGLSPTKIWSAHSDKDPADSLIVMVCALKLSASQIDIAAAGATDSDPFVARHIPQITIHSLTQQNVTTGATTQFRPNNYYDTYRLLCGYLAYLDETLKPRHHFEPAPSGFR